MKTTLRIAFLVPNNTPHWFKEVNGEFLYYTMKVR